MALKGGKVKSSTTELLGCSIKEFRRHLEKQFKDGMSRKSLGLDGTETFEISGIAGGITPRMDVACKITRSDGSSENITLLCRIDTLDEVEYYRHGGILPYVLRNLMKDAA